MTVAVFSTLAAGWLVWVVPFFLLKRNGAAPQQRDRRARWGIALEAVAYGIIWQPVGRLAAPGAARFVPSILFLAAAGLLSWTSARTLGRQWRFDAGLNADHQLIQSGAYGVVRHPIYTSMLCMLIGQGLLLKPLPALLLAVPVFVAGTEIRVRIEDALLHARFGAAFQSYRRAVPAYVPFLTRHGRTGSIG